MPTRLDTKSKDFEAGFRALLSAKRETAADVNAAVAAILADVQARGDAAVAEYTQRFDGVAVTPESLRISPNEIARAANQVPAADFAALEKAAERIRLFHARQMPADDRFIDEFGAELGYRWTPLSSVGLYVPGGKAAYPSSVLMNAIPAHVAGVQRLAMVVPTPRGELNGLVLAAAKIAGVSEVYRVGGAQAVAALAYGTKTIAPVDKIVGPGNAYVAAAKRQVFGTVGIDMVAGPSEILVIADGANNPDWIAADLLSQAEHDETAQSILVTDDAAFADAVARAVDKTLPRLARHRIAAASWSEFGAIIVCRTLAEGAALVDRLAPEHLEIATSDPDVLAAQVRNAGAIFLGRMTPEAIGDYVAGPSHVLPTARAARYASGLSVLDFLKRTSLMRYDERSLKALGPTAATLADAEGLGAHALSVRIRLDS
ncbi:MAG: histidinol dehydrogenase [Alphaproteobacteria bacterium]|nr:histidinol dehydrogenase [Alphaproteobacteria bacterium]